MVVNDNSTPSYVTRVLLLKRTEDRGCVSLIKEDFIQKDSLNTRRKRSGTTITHPVSFNDFGDWGTVCVLRQGIFTRYLYTTHL